MDTSKTEFHFIGYLSWAKDSLERAKSIIALAENSPKNTTTLAGCATILLATALEQAVRTVLAEAAERLGLEEEIHPSKTEPGEYDETSIWWRVQSLPKVLTAGKYRLVHSHRLTKALGELIKTRNALVHVDDPVVHLVGPSNHVKVEDKGVRVTFVQPLSPWACVKLEKVRTFQEAVDAYFSEVLFPMSGEIKQGQIVVPTNI
jgi:hypothetical protein